MPESNIWKFDDRILLPSIHHSWDPTDAMSQRSSMTTQAGYVMGSPAFFKESAKAFFLSETIMARMLRRCTTSIRLYHDREVYAPGIAAELTQQLELWRMNLIPAFAFASYSVTEHETESLPLIDYEPNLPADIKALSLILQMQYHLCLTLIHWPASYSAVCTGETDSALSLDCKLFFVSYAAFIGHASVAAVRCPAKSWYIYAS